jgi:protein disulfide-isomerase
MALLAPIELLANDLKWESDLSAAFENSSTQDKPLMIFIEKDNCKWCEKMRRETLSDSGIQKRLEKFILVKLNKNDLDILKLPYTKYVPTTYFYSPKGEIKVKVIGYNVIEDFNSYIDDYYSTVEE